MSDTLSLRGLRRTFHQGDATLDVLNGADLTIRAGEIVALVGPSGAGKSTLLQIAGLLERPDGGEVIIDGKNCARLSDDKRTALRREHLGFVYQYHHLLPEFSALENVCLPQLIRGKSKAEARVRARALLDSMGLGKRADHRPGQQFARKERLGHVVVGPDLQALGAFVGGVARRHDDDAQARPAANVAQQLQAVAVGQIEIEQDQIHRLGLQGGLHGEAIGGGEGGVTGVGQIGGNHLAHRAVVLDHQNFFLAAHAGMPLGPETLQKYRGEKDALAQRGVGLVKTRSRNIRWITPCLKGTDGIRKGPWRLGTPPDL